MARGHTDRYGRTRLSKEQISEKVKFFGGQRLSTRIDPDADGVEKIIPGSLLMFNTDTGKWEPMLDSDGTVTTAATAVVGIGAGQISPGKVRISIDFWEAAEDDANMIAAIPIGSEHEGQIAYNHEFYPAVGLVAANAPAADMDAFETHLYILNGVIKAEDTLSDLDNGTYLFAALSKKITQEKYEVLHYNTASARYPVQGNV